MCTRATSSLTYSLEPAAGTCTATLRALQSLGLEDHSPGFPEMSLSCPLRKGSRVSPDAGPETQNSEVLLQASTQIYRELRSYFQKLCAGGVTQSTGSCGKIFGT